jgi:hypothetical protein
VRMNIKSYLTQSRQERQDGKNLAAWPHAKRQVRQELL